MQSEAPRIGLVLALGVLFTTPASASAQESAVAAARDAAKAAPASPEASLAYGQALVRAGREADAIVELRRGMGVSAGKPGMPARLGWELARAHIAKREFEAAMATCRGIAKTGATAQAAQATSRVCAAEAHLLWRRGTEAMTELAELAKLKGAPAEVEYFAKIAEGRAQELASKDAEAESAYREAIRLAEGKPEAHVLLGAMLRRTGRDGLPSLRRAAQLDARDPAAALELGRALPHGGAESIAALERAVVERPTYLEALRLLAEGYVVANRLPDAKRTVETVLKLAPNDVGSRVTAGRLALAEGRADDAIKEGEAASKLMPNVQAAKLLVADAWAKKGEIDLAVEAYQAAFGLDHSDPTPLVNASQACLAAGRVTSAKAFGVRATKDFASHGPAWVALGDALAADKDPAGAKSAYENAKKARDVDVAAVDRKLAKLR